MLILTVHKTSLHYLDAEGIQGIAVEVEKEGVPRVGANQKHRMWEESRNGASEVCFPPTVALTKLNDWMKNAPEGFSFSLQKVSQSIWPRQDQVWSARRSKRTACRASV